MLLADAILLKLSPGKRIRIREIPYVALLPTNKEPEEPSELSLLLIVTS